MPTDRYLKCAAQHFGVWAVEPRWFAGTFAAYQSGTLPKAEADYWDSEPYSVTADGIAVVPIVGQITKGESSFGGTSSIATRKAIRKAAEDTNVRAILLQIDSPGGTVAGTPELAAEIQAARLKKPVSAYIEDLGASAAYWLAAQAGSISANATAEVGSIGVFSVVEDSSGRAERLGVRVHVISSGKFKGLGVPGVPVTQEQLDAEQESVDELASMFVDAVANGRKMESDAIKALADGRTWIGRKALAVGLVDKIEPMEDALARMAAETAPRPARRTGRAVALAKRRLEL